jgi:hypothetical protein
MRWAKDVCRPSGGRWRCPTKQNGYRRLYRETNREKIREYDRAWRKRNPEKVREDNSRALWVSGMYLGRVGFTAKERSDLLGSSH